MLPATQVPPVVAVQQPLAHGDEELQPDEQVCVAMLQAVPGQSAAELQPQALITQALPCALEVQSTQARPLPPQPVTAVPAEQLPAMQQPPLHGCDAEQVVVHRCVVVLQALPMAQSVVPLQPQEPPPETISHTLPFGLPVQLWQAPPPTPQAVCMVPTTHEPDEQQPPLHSWVAVQVAVQRWND
jgi:hypothetical protein